MFEQERQFEYENGFYHTSPKNRIGKLLAHYTLYQKVMDLPGAIVECGIFKGASLIRLATFRDLLENADSRKVIGFDIFGRFPDTEYEDDKKYLKKFTDSAGENSITVEEMEAVFARKGINNFELVPGDINETVPAYVRDNPHLKISLLHIDTDVYEPARVILENMYDRVVRGGIIAFDDYGTFPGETAAVDEFLAERDITVRKLSLCHIPSYIVKP